MCCITHYIMAYASNHLKGSTMASDPIHPGQYVRTTYLIPRKISVTDAAKLIGISRPGVSNFLNGKVSTTPEMATRIETAFGMPAATLLEMQAAFDAHGTKTKPAPTSAIRRRLRH